ncbi:uncharacterized protein [Euphorbia lathyris]|uniref:uncharacterized protein n=1 Tax=Euphorbia lathyris TaxID=212925 RepID=UPI0033132FFE
MASQVTDQHGVIPYEVDLFLRICSMFPSAKKEHFKIPIEDLVIYVRCLKLFEDVHDMFAARDRVHSLIHFIDHNHPYKIKKIDYDNQYVKMEVSARDLASIASRYLLVFSHETIMENWPNKIKRFEDCYGLSIVFKQKREYHVNLGHPRLLRLQYGEDSKSLPIDFFERMKEIRVLSLDVPSLPQSLNVLQNLRVLRLKLLKLDNLSAIGGLISLEFLSISTMSLTVVPQEIGELGNLRLLDLSKMNLVYIPQGVLPRMLKLEELYLPFRFRRWGCRVKEEHDDYDELKSREDDDCDDEERINASLSDIGSLSLNALQISVPSISNFPKNSPVLKNLQRFKILVQDDLKYLSTNKGSTNELQLRGDICDIEESGICRLISTTEDLSLTRIRNLKSINHVIYQSEDNDLLHIRLKKMIISECDELEYILYGSQNCYPVFSLFWRLKSLHLSMLSNLREILNGRICFTNLRQINIRFCHKLKYVFPTSMVNELRTLRSIEILDCTGILGIFRNEVDENTHGVHCIEELLLHSLPNFIGFLVLKDDTIDAANQSLITNEVTKNFTRIIY